MQIFLLRELPLFFSNEEEGKRLDDPGKFSSFFGAGAMNGDCESVNTINSSIEPDDATGYWGETVFVVILGTVVILVLSWQSLGTPFFAENFQYMGQFRAADNFFEAVFLPTPDGWYKPVDKFVSILSHELLPQSPIAFGLRNLFTSILIMTVLHRFALRLSDKPFYRILPVLYFASSRVHLSAIGYYNLMGTLLMLLFLLSGLLILWSSLQEGSKEKFAASCVLLGLGMFSKETCLVALPAVVGLLMVVPGKPEKFNEILRWIAIRAAPAAALVLLLLLARKVKTGHMLPVSPVYAPRFEFDILKRNLFVFSTSLSNISLIEPGATGVGGIGFLLQSQFPNQGWVRCIDPVIAFLVPLFFILLIFQTNNRRRLVFPLLWAAASFVIHLTTRNLQLYYTYDLLLAASLVLVITLQDSGRVLRAAAVLIVLVAFTNSKISNQYSTYNWQYVAQHSEDVVKEVKVHCKEDPVSKLIFITQDKSFWSYTLGGGMIPELVKEPEMEVDFYTPDGLDELDECTDDVQYYDLDCGEWIEVTDQTGPD